MDPTLRNFYGGEYLVQQWTKKRKLFQAVHSAKPNKFFLYKQRFIYSMQGEWNECEYLYIVNFYQEVYNKIKHPFFDVNSKDGNHELQVYVDARVIMVASKDRIMWAPFKVEDERMSMAWKTANQNAQNSGDQTPIAEREPKTITEQIGFKLTSTINNLQYQQAIELETQFKSIFASLEGDAPEFLQILDLGSEGYQQKEINAIIECDTKIVVFIIHPRKLRKFTVFKLQEKMKFDKTLIGLEFRQSIQSFKMVNISDTENIYLMTKGQGELTIITDKNKESDDGYRRMLLQGVSSVMGNAQRGNHASSPIEENENEDEYYSKSEVVLKLKSFFARRHHIYFEDINGIIKKLKTSDCKLQRALKRCVKIEQNLVDIQLKEIAMHLQFYSDYIVANTAMLIAHGKILSIYDFKTMKWSHILPQQQGSLSASHQESKDQKQVIDNKQCYFGMPDQEIQSLVLNHVFQNSIYDCLVLYKSNDLKRLKYFNECQKTCFEKAVIFKGNKVKQIVKNYDMEVYRQYGDIVERTYFLIQNYQTGMSEIWVSENGSKMTKLIRNIQKKVQILNLQNAQSDLLTLYEPYTKLLTFYSIENCRQCIDPKELQKFEKNKIENWINKQSSEVTYFYFNNKLFYNEDGNLICYNLKKKSNGNQRKEYNFKSAIKEFYMTNEHSVFYMDKNYSFRFANLRIQSKFDISKLPTKVMDCYGAFLSKLDYCFTTNRFSIFSSPFQVSIIPDLNNYSIDLMSTINFEQNFVFWKQIGSMLHAFKQPNIVISWNLDTGKVIKSSEQSIYIKGFQKHSEWNGATLLKLVRDQSSDIDNDYPGEAWQYEEEKKARLDNPEKHLFSLVDINEEGQIIEKCRFLYRCKIGQVLYASYPYLLMMDDSCTKLYSLEAKSGKFKTVKLINTFYEEQMKVGKPTYFSPNFQHRLYIDPETNELVLNYTLTNTKLQALDIKDQLVWQKNGTHPMVYFHDDEKIVYLTTYGIEKVFQINKKQKKKRTIVTLQEISNCYYNENDFVRRILYDNYNFKRELGCQISHIDMLIIRASIIKRGLLLNEYLLDNEKHKKHIKREYPDKNLGNFSYFIVDNYRRELNFSYMSWKIIEQIANKKLSIKTLRKEYIQLLFFTILPNQETILHHLNDNFEELQNFLKIIEESNNKPANEIPQDQQLKKHKEEKKHKTHILIDDIPFLPNLKGITPLHKSIKKNNTRFTDKIVTVLAETDFDHHSRFIMDKIHHLIDQVPQAFGYYLEKRQKLTSWVTSYTRGKIQPVQDCEFVMASNQMWCENLDESLRQKLFNEEVLEVPMTMHLIDLPNMQKYKNKFADKFLEVLSETDNIELFSSASLRAIVELKWPLVKQAMKKHLFYPYLALLTLFIIYSVFIFEHIQSSSRLGVEFTWDFGNVDFWIRNQKQIIKLLVLGLSMYFFLLNFRSFVIQGPAKFLKNPWRYIDLISLSLITFSLLFEYITSDYPQLERGINAIAVFLLWCKFLYFLRMQRQQSKFISMIVAVIADMRIFLAVFVVSLITFSQSMYIISNNNAEDDRFITSIWDSLLFTYNISLGSWDVGGFGKQDHFIIMTLFIMSTLFLCVVMLNLLIAIISDTYARVDGTSQNELYKNFSDLIIENEYLVPDSALQAHDDEGSYLYIAKIDENEAMGDEMEEQLSSIRDTLTQRVGVLDRAAKDLAKTLSNQLKINTDRFTQMYIEDSMKHEIAFKAFMKRLESGQKRIQRDGYDSNLSIQSSSPEKEEDKRPQLKSRQARQSARNVKEVDN